MASGSLQGVKKQIDNVIITSFEYFKKVTGVMSSSKHLSRGKENEAGKDSKQDNR